MSNHVFISYARADAVDFVRKLHDNLEAMGLNIWLDVEDIPKGANWTLTIQRAIMTCRAFIFIITPGSYESKVCNLELQQAWEDSRDIPILPVYLKDVETVPLLIKNLNYTDCRTDGEAGFQALFDEISKVPEGDDTLDSEIIVPESVTGGATSAQIYREYDDVEFLAQAGLFGRDDLMKQIQSALTGENARVLLQAFGGVGKTALAAQISADWIDEKEENVLWLRAGASDSDTAFEALSHPFGASKTMASTPVGEKPKLLRDLIKSGNIGLVVLDDCWNGQALMAIQKGIPRKVPLLVTARQTYPLTPLIRIPDLPDDEALALLRKLAPDLVQDEEAAKALCWRLSNHAFGIVLAGSLMLADNKTPEALHEEIKSTDVTQLKMPLDFYDTKYDSIAVMIEITLSALPDEAKNVFIAWGAFFSPRITPELMMQYFNVEQEITKEMIAKVRSELSDIDDISDAEIRATYYKVRIRRQLSLEATKNALTLLQRYGLATRQNAQQPLEGRPYLVASYQLHDLGFEYARAQIGDDRRNRAVDACLKHIERYTEPTLENFAMLEPDIDNFMGAANFAFVEQHYDKVENFVENLFRGTNSQGRVLDYRGYYTLSTTLLQQAAEATEKVGNKQMHGTNLGNLGNAYHSLGDYQQAIDYHLQALDISLVIDDKLMEGRALCNLGVVYHSTGDYQQAIDYLLQALDIAETIDDRRIIGSSLGNLGNTYHSLGNYQQAIDYHLQALDIAETIDDRRIIGNSLGNLGNTFSSMANYQRAVDYYLQALNVRRTIGDKEGEGISLGNLGATYDSMGDYQQAIDYLLQALDIAETIGNLALKGVWLGRLGSIYSSMGEYQQAVDYLLQALNISRGIGNKPSEVVELGNLGATYDSMGDYQQAIDYHLQALDIAETIGDVRNKGFLLGSLGTTWRKLGGYQQAVDYYLLGLDIAETIGDMRGKSSHFHNLGVAYGSMGDYRQAIDYLLQALNISQEIGDQSGEGNLMNDIGVTYESLEDYDGAMHYLEQALVLFRVLGVKHRVEITGHSLERVRRKKANQGGYAGDEIPPS